jgi:ribonuclease HepT-like protein
MIGRYAVLAGRIRQDLAEVERVADRVERAIQARRQPAAESDLLLDSAALNLHDFYTGLERIFLHIASGVDQSAPSGPDWHRELLRQMSVDAPGLRPAVLSSATAGAIDEYLRFRHVVRHVYAFQLEPERVERLAHRLRPTVRDVAADLGAFAAWLEGLAHAG